MNGFSAHNLPPAGPFDEDPLLQRVLNAKEGPGPWRNAVMHRLREPVPVTVRVVWERDGVEHLDAIATDWGGLHVLVTITDRRRRFSFLWLHCDDVGRR